VSGLVQHQAARTDKGKPYRTRMLHESVSKVRSILDPTDAVHVLGIHMSRK
jgi:hypothetical protein